MNAIHPKTPVSYGYAHFDAGLAADPLPARHVSAQLAAAPATVWEHPPYGRSRAFVFRVCTRCGQLDIVKEDRLLCGM